MGGSVGGVLGGITGGALGFMGLGSALSGVGAGVFGMNRLNKGIAEATAAQGQANDLYRSLYGQTQKDYAPYQQGGQSAFQALLKTYGLGEGQNGQADYSGFSNSPDYKFAFEQGQNALDRSAASKGMLYSGAQMKGAQQFGQGLATQYLGNYRNGLQGIAGQGMQAANALTGYRAGYGNQLGQGYTNLGDLALAHRIGQANIGYGMVNSLNSTLGGFAGGGQSSYGGGGGGTANFQLPTNIFGGG